MPSEEEKIVINKSAQSAARSAEHKLTKPEIIAIIGGLALAMFLSALDQTIVATALPTIGHALGDFENLPWVVIAYLLTATMVAPLYGKLSDIYGRRRMMLVALGVFMAGSAVSAAASSMLVLILGRALQGFGGGGIVPLTQSIIADIVPPRERGYYQAYTGSVWITAGAVGPLLGGFISQHLHWSMIFWPNLPLCLLAVLLSNRKLKLVPQHERSHKIDLAGAGLMMASAVTLLLALTWGGTHYPWLSKQIIALLIAAPLLVAAFVWWMKRAPEPFLPITVLNNPIMRVGCITSACSQGVNIGLTIYVPIYYQLVHGLSATASGMALIPIVMMTTPGSFLSGRAMLYLNHYKWVPIVMLSFASTAVILLALFPMMPVWVVAMIMCLVGMGTGSSYPVVTVSIQNAIAHRQIGVAMGTMNFFRALASSFVVAIMGAIMLTNLGVAPVRGGPATTVATAMVGATNEDLVLHTFSYIFGLGAMFLLVAIVMLIIMEERPLRTTVLAAPVHNTLAEAAE
ncbi:MAG TPA: MDR family MFS transporter [Xanthobacteraceae bacterium]|nr:MDR family MFS transporter [Xanthobacteraceae bacterium]